MPGFQSQRVNTHDYTSEFWPISFLLLTYCQVFGNPDRFDIFHVKYILLPLKPCTVDRSVAVTYH